MMRMFTLFQLAILGLLCAQNLASAQSYINYTLLNQFERDSIGEMVGFQVDNGVYVYRITYEMIDYEGRLDTASGLLVIPDIAKDNYPVVSYQHGTSNTFNDVPSKRGTGYWESLGYGGSGFISCAADYQHMGVDRGRDFPTYLHSKTEALSAIYLLLACRDVSEELGTPWNDFLFISGYSQGGHAAASVHREIQENWTDEFQVTASAPMSGPYALSTVFKDIILSDEEYVGAGFVAWVILSYEHIYGNLYEQLDDVFRPGYIPAIEAFENGEASLTEISVIIALELLVTHGGIFVKYMFHNHVIEELDQDPNHPINLALEDNDVHSWSPDAPVRLYYCNADEIVPFQNALFTEATMNNLGAEDVSAQSINPGLGHGACATPAIIESISFFSSFLPVLPVEEYDKTLVFRIYPNPTYSALWVETTSETDKAEFKIMDLQGRTLKYGVLKAESIPLHTLNPGLYILEVLTNDARGVTTFVIGQ